MGLLTFTFYIRGKTFIKCVRVSWLYECRNDQEKGKGNSEAHRCIIRNIFSTLTAVTYFILAHNSLLLIRMLLKEKRNIS